MGELHSFEWALMRTIKACEDARLDPPLESEIVDCPECDGVGILKNDPCWRCDATGEIEVMAE